MTIYVFLELWRCFCMELRDSRRKHPIYSLFSSGKLVGLILQTRELFVWKILQHWRIMSGQMFSHTYWQCRMLRGGVFGNTNTVWLLRFNSPNGHISNNNALFKAHRCPSSDQFIKKVYDLERHLATCKKINHVFPKNVYQLPETLFDKLDLFNFPYSDYQKFFRNMAIFDFESVCLQEDKFRETDTTTWIGKHIPISVSLLSNLTEQSIFSYNSDPRVLVKSFVVALDGLATQNKVEMKINLSEIEGRD